MKNIFYGKTVVITGGSSGIGAALAHQLTSLGATVVSVGRSPNRNHDAHYFQADMAVYQQAESVFKKITKNYGSIDYFINSAGIFMGGEIRDTPIKEWHHIMNNNVGAVANGTYLAYEHMIGNGVGHIINIASTAGLIPVPAMGIYGSTKYALVGLTHALRHEAAALGINVSVVCPTIVNTPLYDTATYNRVDMRKLLTHRTRLQTAEQAATKIIKGIQKNKATIHTSWVTLAIWRLYRLNPALYDIFAKRIIRQYRSNVRKDKER